MNEIDANTLEKLFVHDAVDGRLYWKRRHAVMRCDRIFNSRFAGKEAGSVNSLGYRVVGIGGKTYFVHRIIFALKHGVWPQNEVDHAGSRAENNKIRGATRAQNAWNRGRTRRNKSGHKNISRDGAWWRVEISAHGGRTRKRFKRLNDAIAFARQMRTQKHGEFANHG